jgi:hypothetical protein
LSRTGQDERVTRLVEDSAMAQYVVRVGGALSDELLTAFPRLVATVQPVTTVLQGDLPDQVALTSVLDRLDELGIEIIEVTKVPARPALHT